MKKSTSFTEIVENPVTSSPVVSSASAPIFPGDPNVLGGNLTQIESRSLLGDFVESRTAAKPVPEDLGMLIETLNTARPTSLTRESYEVLSQRIQNNDPNALVSDALNFDRAARVIINDAIAKLQIDTIAEPSRRVSLVRSINEVNASAINSANISQASFSPLNIDIPIISQWRDLLPSYSTSLHGMPSRILEILFLLGDEFSSRVTLLVNSYLRDSLLSEIFIYTQLGILLAPFFGLFFGFRRLQGISMDSWRNTLRRALLSTEVIFSGFRLIPSSRVETQARIDQYLAVAAVGTTAIHEGRRSIAVFSWYNFLWSSNEGFFQNIMRIGLNVSLGTGTIGVIAWTLSSNMQTLIRIRDFAMRGQRLLPASTSATSGTSQATASAATELAATEPAAIASQLQIVDIVTNNAEVILKILHQVSIFLVKVNFR